MDACIIRTLSYFDVFDYPLTLHEIKKYLCCKIDCTNEDFLEIIQSIPIIQVSNGYYYLLGRQEITQKRSERSVISVKKYAKAIIVSKLLSMIPTIEYIGISGSLSMNNAAATDDIDLFFITKKGTLWMSRLAVVTMLFFLRQKRNKNERNITDKICPNMFMEMGKLKFAKKRRDEYTAHEIVQLKTLFDRGSIYAYFLSKNKWIKNYIYNISLTRGLLGKQSFGMRVALKMVAPVEKIVFGLQYLYMKKSKTIEEVGHNKAFFHPIDRSTIVMDMFDLRYERYSRIYEENLWVDKDEARFYLDEKKIRILN